MSTTPTDSPSPRAERAARLREYRTTWRPMGVWALRCLPTGKLLVGASANLPAAWNGLRFALMLGSHPNAALVADWRRHGAEAFAFEVLDTLTPPPDDGRPRAALEQEAAESLAVLRDLWLAELRPWGDRGYCPAPSGRVRPPAR
jgi:hypothetical protein